MMKFNTCVSLIIMFVGVAMASQAIVICGFVSTSIWAAADEVIKTIKQQGGPQ